MVILDTNILIDYLRRPQNTDSYLVQFTDLHPKEILGVSIITIQELYAGQSSKVLDKEQQFLQVISNFKILSYFEEVACLAGQLTRDSSKKIEFADAAIAATVVLNKAKLLTLNKKDFQGIKRLKLV